MCRACWRRWNVRTAGLWPSPRARRIAVTVLFASIIRWKWSIVQPQHPRRGGFAELGRTVGDHRALHRGRLLELLVEAGDTAQDPIPVAVETPASGSSMPGSPRRRIPRTSSSPSVSGSGPARKPPPPRGPRRPTAPSPPPRPASDPSATSAGPRPKPWNSRISCRRSGGCSAQTHHTFRKTRRGDPIDAIRPKFRLVLMTRRLGGRYLEGTSSRADRGPP